MPLGGAVMQRSSLAAALALLLVAQPARAQDSWIDGPRTPWNRAGMAVPATPPGEGIPVDDPRCSSYNRQPERPEDEAVVGAGWALDGPYQAGWVGVVIRARTSSDG